MLAKTVISPPSRGVETVRAWTPRAALPASDLNNIQRTLISRHTDDLPSGVSACSCQAGRAVSGDRIHGTSKRGQDPGLVSCQCDCVASSISEDGQCLAADSCEPSSGRSVCALTRLYDLILTGNDRSDASSAVGRLREDGAGYIKMSRRISKYRTKWTYLQK